MTLRRGAGTLLLLLSACGDDGRGALDLEQQGGANESACAEVVIEAVELSGELHRYLADVEGGGGWGLLSRVGMDGPELMLERVPASPEEPPTALIELDLPPNLVALTRLRAGASTGEAWLFFDTPLESSLVHVVPELGALVRNDLIANFPVTAPSSSCPTDYTRELMIVAGQPYVLAVPDCSDSPGLTLELLALELDTLNFGQSWQLEFDPCADTDDPAGCALLLAYTLPEIGRARAASFPHSTRAQAGFAQTRVFSQLVPDSGSSESRDLALLDMDIDADGPRARVITYREVWPSTMPALLGPVALSKDFYSTQLFVRNVERDDDAALLRFGDELTSYAQLRDPDLLPFGGRGELLQLRDQGALLHADEQGVRGVGLSDIESWGAWREHTISELADVVALEPAGVGHVLVHREELPPQLLSVTLPLGGSACAPAEP